MCGSYPSLFSTGKEKKKKKDLDHCSIIAQLHFWGLKSQSLSWSRGVSFKIRSQSDLSVQSHKYIYGYIFSWIILTGSEKWNSVARLCASVASSIYPYDWPSVQKQVCRLRRLGGTPPHLADQKNPVVIATLTL